MVCGRALDPIIGRGRPLRIRLLLRSVIGLQSSLRFALRAEGPSGKRATVEVIPAVSAIVVTPLSIEALAVHKAEHE